MKILITGCAGLLGSRFAKYLLDMNPAITVVGIDDLSGGFIENVDPRMKFYQIDLNQYTTVENIFSSYEFTHVYHFAAYAAEGLSPFIRRFNYTNNLLSTTGIVNLCIKYGIRRLVFTSSMAVYGIGTPPFDESHPRNPIDPYGVAKMACEMDIEIASQQHGLEYCIIRPHNVVGWGQNIWDSYRNFVGICVYKGLIGDPITIYGDGLQTRAFSEMNDILEPLYQAGVSPSAKNEIINLGGITPSTILDVAKYVQQLTGVDIIHLAPRHEVKHAHSSWQKSVDLLGFEHRTSLEDTITGIYTWAKIQPPRSRFIWNKYELDVGLYDYWKPDKLKDGYYKPAHSLG